MYYLKLLALFVLSFTFAATALGQERILRFPPDQSLGQVTLESDIDALDGWRSIHTWWGGTASC